MWILEDSPLEGEMARRALSLSQDVEIFTDGSVVLERMSSSAGTLPDVIDSCASTAKQEVVFKFTAPATAGYTLAARDPGTANVSNSTQILDASCMPLPGCAALTGHSFNAGQTVYFVVEASSAACAMIEFESN